MLTYFEQAVAKALAESKPLPADAGMIQHISAIEQWRADVTAIASHLVIQLDRISPDEFIEACGGII